MSASVIPTGSVHNGLILSLTLVTLACLALLIPQTPTRASQ